MAGPWGANGPRSIAQGPGRCPRERRRRSGDATRIARPGNPRLGCLRLAVRLVRAAAGTVHAGPAADASFHASPSVATDFTETKSPFTNCTRAASFTFDGLRA